LWQAGYSDAIVHAFVILSVIWLAVLVSAKSLAAKLPEFRRGRLPQALAAAGIVVGGKVITDRTARPRSFRNGQNRSQFSF
jgi:hypothetical protein